jgi:hypothetical protein
MKKDPHHQNQEGEDLEQAPHKVKKEEEHRGKGTNSKEEDVELTKPNAETLLTTPGLSPPPHCCCQVCSKCFL